MFAFIVRVRNLKFAYDVQVRTQSLRMDDVLQTRRTSEVLVNKNSCLSHCKLVTHCMYIQDERQLMCVCHTQSESSQINVKSLF